MPAAPHPPPTAESRTKAGSGQQASQARGTASHKTNPGNCPPQGN